jgi:hypothetical protein
MNSEKGQILPLTLVALAIGSAVIMPFIGHASSNIIGSQVYQQAIIEQYSADSGIEHAIWRLINGGLADELPSPGDSTTYLLTETINGVAPSITVTRDNSFLASDEYESGGWSDGSGWLADWYHQGKASVTPSGSPHQGKYHLQLRSNTGYARRAVDLSGYDSARLQFWAKTKSFDSGEEARCLVSSDGGQWVEVRAWTDGDDDNIYHPYDIDLSSYDLTSQFWISFEADMSGGGGYLYVDLLNITPPSAIYQIISRAGDRTVEAIVRIENGSAAITSWEWLTE